METAHTIEPEGASKEACQKSNDNGQKLPEKQKYIDLGKPPSSGKCHRQTDAANDRRPHDAQPVLLCRVIVIVPGIHQFLGKPAAVKGHSHTICSVKQQPNGPSKLRAQSTRNHVVRTTAPHVAIRHNRREGEHRQNGLELRDEEDATDSMDSAVYRVASSLRFCGLMQWTEWSNSSGWISEMEWNRRMDFVLNLTILRSLHVAQCPSRDVQRG